MSKAFDALVLTCEHGGHGVPAPYEHLFKGQGKVLRTHRGWDIGALAVARRMAKDLGASLHFAVTTRLLIDLNRSLHVKGVWSRYSRDLGREEKAKIVAKFYTPFRSQVEAELARLVDKGRRVLHLSIHSFTPELRGEARNAEVGVLYDPKRSFERSLATRLYDAVKAAAPDMRVRKNYPYLGYTDGFTTYLRRRLPASRYAGIEIETRQDEIGTVAGQRRYAELYADVLRSL